MDSVPKSLRLLPCGRGKERGSQKKHHKLNPTELKRQITKLRDKLRKIGLLKKKEQNYKKTMIKKTKI